MRFLLVGLVLFLIPTRALAQAAGYVESIGFAGAYRPDCWTPMLVSLTSQISEPAEYQIQVIQHDLDQDREVFARTIALNPQEQEKFWVYFIPQPSGLDSSSLDALSRSIQVWLCTAPGPDGKSRQIRTLPIRLQIYNVDQGNPSFLGEPKGAKLVVCVSDPQESSNPAFEQYSHALGLTESLDHVEVHPAELPENVIGYDSVSAIVWFGASSAELDAAGNKRLEALEAYVRRGGRLIICQPDDVHRLSEFADLLPVQLRDDRGNWLIDVRRCTVDPLIELATDTVSSGAGGMTLADRKSAWQSLGKHGGVKLAFATPKPDAVWEVPIHWPDGGISPFIVRRGYGAGSVTWVAMDLGNPALTGPHVPGWAYVWDAVFGWKSAIRAEEDATDSDRNAFATTGVNSTDLGAAVLPAMEFPSRGAAYITVAIIFFLIYGLVAGPISYFVLASRKRKDLSWFVFALCACAGTLLTVVVVRLVLHGDAELHHLSLVRICPDSSAIVRSRIGLYVPHGDLQRVELSGNSPDAVSYLTAYALPPDWFTSTEFPAAEKYLVPVHDPPLDEPVAIDVPIRSTLKKLQARWVGDLPASIDGKPTLLPPGTGAHYLTGTLTNDSGVDLVNVYIAYSVPTFSPPEDWMLYVPKWDKGDRLDLAKTLTGAKYLRLATGMPGALPGENSAINAPLSGPAGWSQYFYGRLLQGSPLAMQSDQFTDPDPDVPISVPMLSFFDRLGPSRADKANSQARVELLRQGARDFDLSPAVEAGKLAIVAAAAASDQSAAPLPEPMTVNGSPIAGDGRVLYQFVLPIDRTNAGLPPPTSQPATVKNEDIDHGLHG
ncbi:MAG TPA: hypothetical protein VHY37_09685 [Tepidisphaeraceae bacterium]|jgi:hypothetical protein|nr:hypothetical protein [Tepidisphaeraceae bacterium]